MYVCIYLNKSPPAGDHKVRSFERGRKANPTRPFHARPDSQSLQAAAV